ncbi:phage tail terminator family protein [Clostridium butyricum]
MIKYNELLYFTGKRIKDHFKKCKLRVEKNQEDIKEPTFYVEVRALNTNSYKPYVDKLVNISITYTDKVVDGEKLNNVLNDLESVFDLGIKVKDTFLIFKSKNNTMNDDFLTLNLTINYKDDRDIVDENDYYSELMEELYVDFNRN